MTEYKWKSFLANLLLYEFDLDVEDVTIQLCILQALLAIMKEALGKKGFDLLILRDEMMWMFKNERPSTMNVSDRARVTCMLLLCSLIYPFHYMSIASEPTTSTNIMHQWSPSH